MTNKPYASTMLLLRIGVLAAQISVSPSTARRAGLAALRRLPIFRVRLVGAP